MRGFGDFQRKQMRRGDPRIREMFSRARQMLDLLEDIYNRPYEPPAPADKPRPPPSVPPLMVNLTDAHKTLGITRTRLYELINEGKIRAYKAGKRTMFRYSDLAAFIDTLDEGIRRDR